MERHQAVSSIWERIKAGLLFKREIAEKIDSRKGTKLLKCHFLDRVVIWKKSGGRGRGRGKSSSNQRERPLSLPLLSLFPPRVPLQSLYLFFSNSEAVQERMQSSVRLKEPFVNERRETSSLPSQNENDTLKYFPTFFPLSSFALDLMTILLIWSPPDNLPKRQEAEKLSWPFLEVRKKLFVSIHFCISFL